MPRGARVTPPGYIYHVLNRAVARLPLFKKAADFEAFLRVLDEALELHPTRILAYCIMGNHWHFVVQPARDGEITDFFRWLTHTHTMRWHAHHRTVGTGHLYQGRFKAFPVEGDEHLYTLLRYVERNALRARLVERAEDWRWSSLYHRIQGLEPKGRLSPWPLPLPRDWVERVNRAEAKAELEHLRISINRGQPFGSDSWKLKTVKKLGLESTIRPRGRPRREEPAESDEN